MLQTATEGDQIRAVKSEMLLTTQGTLDSSLEETKTTEGTLDGASEESDKMLQTATEGTLDGASEESDKMLQTATEGILVGASKESDSNKMLLESTEGTLDGTFEPKNRKFDDILQEVGDFSKFQYIQWTILVLITMPQVWYTYAPAFAARKVKDQLSCGNHGNITGRKPVCQIWHNKTYCGDVKYSTDFTSIATDWDIICEDAKKYIPLTKTIFYAGKLVGAYLFGWVSDRYGRRVTLLSTIFIQFVSSLIQSFSVNLTMYVLLRIPLGICSGGVLIAAFTLMTEMVRPNRRMWGTTIIMATLGVSLTVTSFMAYLVRDWKQFNLAITLPNILAIIACLCFVSESPRWLTARGRFKEADKILVKMASTNRKEYKKGEVEEITIKEKKKTYHIWHLFSTRYLTRISVIEGWSWMVTSGVFYGIAFNSSNLSGNFYLNYAASGMAEIPAPLFAGFLLERVGRRKPLIVYYLLSGIFLLSISRIQALGKQDELSAVVMALALVGKTTISAAYYQIYIFSAELYPTVIRVAGMGFASLCGRIGGMAAPYIVDSTSLTVPCIVFGVASITAGIATLFLPETLGKHLQDQIEQDRRKNGKTVDKVHMIEIE